MCLEEAGLELREGGTREEGSASGPPSDRAGRGQASRPARKSDAVSGKDAVSSELDGWSYACT